MYLNKTITIKYVYMCEN